MDDVESTAHSRCIALFIAQVRFLLVTSVVGMTLFVPVLWWWQGDPSQCVYPDPENYVAQGTVNAKSRGCFSLVFDMFDLELTGLKKIFYETWCFPMLTAEFHLVTMEDYQRYEPGASSAVAPTTICDIAARKQRQVSRLDCAIHILCVALISGTHTISDVG
jgi:hypothetical protein